MQSIKAFPVLVRKEVLALLLSLAAVLFLSALWNAPIEGPAHPQGIPEQDVKAPWIFLWIQQMLRYIPALVAGIIIPSACAALIAAIPWITDKRHGAATVVRACFFGILGGSLALTVWGLFG
jgi:quinol-cytochrome oxidoreductase complex cytochrome b subunit